MSTSRRTEPVHSESLAVRSALVGAIGLALWGVGLLTDPYAALRGWLTAWEYGLSVALGALCLIMIAYVTGGRWFVVVRRVAEAIAMSLPALALGVVPILLGMKTLYPWARPLDTLTPDVRDTVGKISAWLNPTFFTLRAFVYLVVWMGLAALLWRASVATDGRDPEETAREPRPGSPAGVSALGLVLFAFTVTFASFDWLMSMTPTWHSTVFGVYWFAGAMIAALSVMVLLTYLLQTSGALRDEVAASHYYALGRLLLTFVVFWAYIAYSQGFLIWIGDIPRETHWYLARWGGGWKWVLGILVVGQFALPFLVLLNYAIKRRPRLLSWVAVWLLVVHGFDLYWVVGPAPDGSSVLVAWEQVPALVAVLGLGFAFGAWRLDGRPAAPRGDPAYPKSLGYDAK